MAERLTGAEVHAALALGLCLNFEDDEGFGCEPEEPPCIGHAQEAADILAARAQTATGDGLAERLTALADEWEACWCNPQCGPDDDPRVRDCPRHGSNDCRHMAAGIVTALRAALASDAGRQG